MLTAGSGRPLAARAAVRHGLDHGFDRMIRVAVEKPPVPVSLAHDLVQRRIEIERRQGRAENALQVAVEKGHGWTPNTSRSSGASQDPSLLQGLVC